MRACKRAEFRPNSFDRGALARILRRFIPENAGIMPRPLDGGTYRDTNDPEWANNNPNNE